MEQEIHDVGDGKMGKPSLKSIVIKTIGDYVEMEHHIKESMADEVVRACQKFHNFPPVKESPKDDSKDDEDIKVCTRCQGKLKMSEAVLDAYICSVCGAYYKAEDVEGV